MIGSVNQPVIDLGALTTTNKSSPTAAINEIDANSDANAAALATINSAGLPALPASNLMWDPYQVAVQPGVMFGGNRVRYSASFDNLIATKGDANNPFGGTTLTLPLAYTNWAKSIHIDEAGFVPGDTVHVGIVLRGASGVCRLYVYSATSASTPTVSIIGTFVSVTMDGNVQTLTTSVIVPANCKRLDIMPYNFTKSADLNVYAIWATLNRPTSYPAPMPPLPSLTNCVVWDPTNRISSINGVFGGRARWRNAATGVTLVTADAANPFAQGNTIRLDVSTTYFAKLIYPDECGLKEGDIVTFSALVASASGQCRIYIYMYGAVVGGTALGSVATTKAMTGAPQNLSVSGEVLAGTRRIEVWIYRFSGTNNIDVYGIWGGSESNQALGYSTDEAIIAEVLAARGGAASIDARLDSIEAATSVVTPYPAQQIAYGRHLLRSWHGALARIRGADATTQAVVAWIGDSWINGTARLHAPLKTLLQATYGNAGPGYCSAATTLMAVPGGVSITRTGTWVDHDWSTTPAGYGPDLFDALSSNVGATVAWTATATDFILLYVKQTTGGTFRYKVDAGAWTTIDTAGAMALGTVSITGLSNASHVLTVEVVTSGAAGVLLLGVDCRLSGNGVRVHKLGASGSKAGDWAAHPDASILTAAIATLSPCLVAVTLGTNDHSANVVPATFATSVATLITTVKGALDAQALIVSAADNGNAGSYTMQQYIDAQRASVVANGYGMLDSLLLLGPYAAANTRGLYDDTSHINATAGRIIDGMLLDELLTVL